MPMSRVLRAGLLLPCSAFGPAALLAQDTEYPAAGGAIPGPAQPADFQKWLKDIRHWRDERKVRIAYDGSQYNRPELAWTRDNFIQSLMMAEERYFYDPGKRQYTVDRYLEDLARRYGGIDSVVIWPVYPNLGIDSRNQNDFLRDLPGGVAAIRQVVEDFRRRKVKVFFPVNPWDRGTREAAPLDAAAVELFSSLGADGVFGDTMNSVPRTFRSLSDRLGRPLALEPEGDMPEDEPLLWTTCPGRYGSTVPATKWSRACRG